MVENEGNLKEIIVEYVLKYPGCSQSCIINYMRGCDSAGNPVEEKSRILIVLQTTRNILDILTGKKGDESPILIALPSEKSRRYLKYYVIDDLQIIDKELKDIESLILTMDFPIHKLNKLKFIIDKLPGPYPKKIPITHLKLLEYGSYAPKYIGAYSGAVRAILYYLFERLSIIRIPKEHSNIFYYRIIELIRMLNNQTLEIKDPQEDVNFYRNIFSKLRKELDTGSTVKNYFGYKQVDKFINTLDEFDNLFLNQVKKA